MKKVWMVLSVAAALFTGSAMAEDVPFEFRVLSYKEAGDQFKVSVNAIQKGVFVQVGHGMAAKHPKAKSLIEETLKKNNIKVAQNVEDADYGLQFDDISNDYLDRIEADSGSETSLGILGKQTLVNFALLVTVGTPSSMNIKHELNPDKPIPARASFSFAKNPHLSWVKILSGDEFKKNNVELMSKINRLGKNGDGFDAKTLVGLTEGYITMHFEGLPGQAPVAAPASVVAPVASK